MLKHKPECVILCSCFTASSPAHSAQKLILRAVSGHGVSLPYTCFSPPRNLGRHQVFTLFPFLELLHYFFFLECSPTTSYVQFSLIYVGYLSKSSSLGDGDAFSNYCHPRYELLHLCLSSYWFCLFFSLPFVVDSHPRNTAISIHVASFVLGHTLLSSQDFVSCFLLYHLQPKLHLTSERFYQTDSTDK